jgi:hypothetical protein
MIGQTESLKNSSRHLGTLSPNHWLGCDIWEQNEFWWDAGTQQCHSQREPDTRPEQDEWPDWLILLLSTMGSAAIMERRKVEV